MKTGAQTKTILASIAFSVVAVAQSAAPVKLAPEDRGDLYMVRKMYREAIDAYRSAGPNSAVLWNKIGIAYHQLGELEPARKSYARAVKLDKKFADAINNEGTVFYAQKKYRTAVVRYKKALTISPNSAAFWSNLGTAYYARGNFEEMAKAYARALELNPEIFEVRGSIGTRVQERNVEDKARYHYELARMYANAGKNELALQYLRKALEEGFKQREKLQGKEFAALRETQEFKDLMSLEPRVL